MIYSNWRCAHQRLVGTYVRWDRSWVRVDSIDQQFLCSVTDHRGREVLNVPMGSLNLKSPPLGYVNLYGETLYVKRMPKRSDWRQGIREQNVNMPRRTPLRLLYQPVFNEYESLQDAAEHAINLHESRAFHRKFCVLSDGNIQYRGSKVVANIDFEDRTVISVNDPSFIDVLRGIAGENFTVG